MMNYIWAGMMLISVIFAIVNGRGREVTDALFSGSQSAVSLCITLLASMCLWGGLMKIADRAGLTRALAKIFRPLLRLLFPGLNPDGPAARAVCMNVAANMLGLGNAATPLGLEAMREFKKLSPPGDTAANHMITFVVLNTASLQILPTTVAALRQNAGSANPMEIMPAVLLSSLGALTVGMILARTLNKLTVNS
ncbi:MAG: spore maturation protein A [Oscillospiraceae bacterium]|jgi:spore maturation protein A|nr:spore maturation protein A [Oscillospiraceae bacterium]